MQMANRPDSRLVVHERSRTSAILARMHSTERATWLTVFVALLYLYLVTGHWTAVHVNDAIAANWPAWTFVHHGTFFLDHIKHLPRELWFVHSGGHLVSNRMAGVIFIGVPAQAVFALFAHSPNVAGGVTAAVVTAAAVATLAVVLRRVCNSELALAAALCVGAGTAFWTAASSELWTHGPDALWLSLSLLALTRDRYLLCGLALVPALMTRPHLAVVAATLGLLLSWRKRAVRPAIAIGVPSITAMALLVAWNTYYYGSPSIGGGYAGREDALTGQGAGNWAFVRDIAGTMGSPLRGLLLYTPVAVVGCLCLVLGWRRAPDWARAALLGGVLYEAVQLRLNRYSGGTGFYSNRLIVELLLLAAPLVVLGYQEWRNGGRHRVTLTRALVMASVGIHAVGALFPNSYLLHPQYWTTWGPVAAVRYETGPAIAIIVATVIVGAIVTVWPLRRRTSSTTEPAPALAAAGAATPG